MALEIVGYEDIYSERWDKFVMGQSMNGTFLHTRNFLGYHPKGRFKDASIMVMQGSHITAVIPACESEEGGGKCFFSHRGSTFGGIVVERGKYNISFMEELFPVLEGYLKEKGFEHILLKMPSDIFSEQKNDLFDYYFFQKGYDYFNEISFYIDCKKLPEDVLLNLSGSRRRDYRYSLKNNLSWKHLEDDEEIKLFYAILTKNLRKFHAKPVHTLEELLEFKNNRLAGIVDFYGVYYKEKLVAGTMLFYFEKNVMHTQYLAQDPEYSNLFAMNFMDVQLIQLARERGFRYFSFGISTENRGRVLNRTLALFKEGFGCDYCVNRSYSKELKGMEFVL